MRKRSLSEQRKRREKQKKKPPKSGPKGLLRISILAPAMSSSIRRYVQSEDIIIISYSHRDPLVGR